MTIRRKKGKFSPGPYTEERIQLTADQEIELIRSYQESRDRIIAERLLKSRSSWVQSILSRLTMPSFVDLDSVFTDAMLSVYKALATYDDSKSSLSTYLNRVVHNSARDSINDQNPESESLEGDHIIDDVIDYSECLANATKVILSATDDQMNERARKVAHMMLKGYGVQEIAIALEVTKTVADEIVASMRKYIAWMMVRDGLTAEPLIQDQELLSLAMEHERANLGCWR